MTSEIASLNRAMRGVSVANAWLRGFDGPAAMLGWTAIIGYFIWYAAGGLRAHFSPDDMQNIYTYWGQGWQACASAIVTFWSSFYRPLGAAFYLPLFRVAGFDPLPYRFVIFVLVTLNMLIYTTFARMVSSNLFVTLVALSVWLFHGALFLVYYSNAIIYDILCFLFYIASMAVYAKIRLSGNSINWSLGLVVLLFSVLALDAKEMAASLPLTLLLMELIVFWPSLRDWPRCRKQLILLGGMIIVTIIYFVGKTTGPDALANVDAYHPRVSLDAWTQSLVWYTSQLLYREGQPLSAAAVLGVWAVLLVLAVAARSRLALFGLLSSLIALLPVSFISPRQ
jgi:hypothetical protein